MDSSLTRMLFGGFFPGNLLTTMTARLYTALGSTARKKDRGAVWTGFTLPISRSLYSVRSLIRQRLLALLAAVFQCSDFFEQSRKVRPATTRPNILQRQVLFLNKTELKRPLLSDLYRHHFPKLKDSEKDQIQTWSALALATFNFVYQ